MAQYYFPGCRMKAGYTRASEKLTAYMKERYDLDPMGCCKEDYTKLQDGDTAVLICNNCICDLPQNGVRHEILMIPQLIDEDPEFPFPDYQGREMIFQNCHHGYGEIPMGDIAQSLLTKMNVHTILMEEERDIPAGLAGPDHMALAKKNAGELPEGEMVTCCGICNLAMRQAGRRTHLLMELLFDEA